MIDSIGSSANFRPPPPQNSANNNLSNDQISLIENTLSNYDAGNLSQEDASTLVQTFSDAGINPGTQFADMLAESGFDAREIGSLANAGEGEPRGQRPPPSGGESGNGLDLSSVIDYLNGLSSDESQGIANSSNMAAQLAAQFGLSEGQSLINVTA